MAIGRRSRREGHEHSRSWWNDRARQGGRRRKSLWWDERLSDARRPLARASSILLGCEAKWIHRRTHWVDFTGSGIRWTMGIDFAVPDLREYPRELPLIVPLAMPEKETSIFDFDVRDAHGCPLPVLTGAENSALSAEILRIQAERILGVDELDPKIDCQLRLIAGDDIEAGDSASLPERIVRAREALAYFQSLQKPASAGHAELDTSMYKLWSDTRMMRGLLSQLARRFIVFVEVAPAALPAGTRLSRRIVTISYEREFYVLPKDVFPLGDTSQGPPSWSAFLRQDLKGAFEGGLKMREPLNAQSTHIHVACLDELLVTRAAAQQVVLRQDHGQRALLEVLPAVDGAIVERTQQVHLHLTPNSWRELDSSKKEFATFMVLTFSAVLRAGSLLPALIAAGVMAAVLTAGPVLWALGVSPSGDVAAVIVAAPALFVPLTAPGEAFLVRRMFQAFRLLLYAVTVAGFAAAALIVTDVSTVWKLAGWSLAALICNICSVTFALAFGRAFRIARIQDRPNE